MFCLFRQLGARIGQQAVDDMVNSGRMKAIIEDEIRKITDREMLRRGLTKVDLERAEERKRGKYD